MKLFQKIKEAEEAKPVSKGSFTRSIAATAALLVVLTAATTAWITTAWFSSNRETESTGAKMDIDSRNPNLIIVDATPTGSQTVAQADTAANTTVRGITVATAPNYFSVTLTASGANLAPATHDWTVGTATGLKYVKNPSIIDRSTGVKKTAAGTPDYNYGAVPEYTSSDTRRYYYDYILKLSSTEIEMAYSKILGTLTFHLDTSATLQDYHHAASMDIYIGSVSSGNYQSTVDLHTITGNNSVVNFVVDNSSGTVPLNTTAAPGDCCKTLILRFYFDGALESSSGQAYVYSNNLSAQGFSMDLSFEAVDPENPTT